VGTMRSNEAVNSLGRCLSLSSLFLSVPLSHLHLISPHLIYILSHLLSLLTSLTHLPSSYLYLTRHCSIQHSGGTAPHRKVSSNPQAPEA
jgi:hypothetical protein